MGTIRRAYFFVLFMTLFMCSILIFVAHSVTTIEENSQCCTGEGEAPMQGTVEKDKDITKNNISHHDHHTYILHVDKDNQVQPLRGTAIPKVGQLRQNGVSLFLTNVTTDVGKAPTQCPPELKFAAVKLPKTALFSAPGCGNTWVRHLLQLATGIYTGSIYRDGSISMRGFKGEGRDDGTVIAVKNHEAFNLDLMHAYKRAILIYRRPQEAVLAEYKRRRAGHTGQLDLKGKLLTDLEVGLILRRWRNTNRNWLLNYTHPIHVAHYEDLKSDLVGEMTSILRFLRWEVTPDQMTCMSVHGEGKFHRKGLGDPMPDSRIYSEKLLKDMVDAEQFIESCFDRRKELGFPIST